jgi:hypothetical protein
LGRAAKTSGHSGQGARPPGRPGPSRGGERGRVLAWLTFAVAILVLASPLKLAWARPALGWTFPFVLWLGVIALGIFLGRGDDGDGA